MGCMLVFGLTYEAAFLGHLELPGVEGRGDRRVGVGLGLEDLYTRLVFGWCFDIRLRCMNVPGKPKGGGNAPGTMAGLGRGWPSAA